MQTPKALLGRLILKDKILDNGAVIVENGEITYVGKADGVTLPTEQISAGERYIAPGFVDIHNHFTMKNHDDVDLISEAALYHLKNGTTSCLFTLYRDVPHEKILKLFDMFPTLLKTLPHLIGFHLEGPYLNPKYGSSENALTSHVPDPTKYNELIKSGLIKQWTFAPEVEGTLDFLRALTKAGIAPAIGHSAASPEDVARAAENGARIVTHLFNATGASLVAGGGVRVLSFDGACMLQNDLFYEIICDQNEVHVRHDIIRLLLKTVGVNHVVAISDFCGMPNSDSDVRYADNGELAGSCMTIRQAAKNFSRVGLSLVDIFKVCALNPARAIGMDAQFGSLAAGKKANILFTDPEFTDVSVMLNGDFIQK